MGVTITEIAKEAGVSIATVSHVLNHTRYVSPELAEKIQQIAEEKGYQPKHNSESAGKKYRMGKSSEIALVIPNTFSIVYTRLVTVLSELADTKGYILCIYLSNGDKSQEKHVLSELIANRRIAGIILCPVQSDRKAYKKLIQSAKPFVCLERKLEDSESDSVVSDNVQGVREMMEHLINSGHERIALLLEDKCLTTVTERKEGYLQVIWEHEIGYDEELIACIQLEEEKQTRECIKRFIKKKVPTAILAGGNTLTLRCLKAMDEMGLECPRDISVAGFGDDEWCELMNPSLTVLTQDTEELGRRAIAILFDRIEQRGPEEVSQIKVPMELTVRKSTTSIARGPFGEKVVYPEENLLTDQEIELVKAGNYKVAISFHYTGNEWTRLHEKAIKDSLSTMGVRVLSVADANFDPELQNTQLEGIEMQNPDGVIAVPTDEIKTAGKFKELAKKTKLVFVNNVPYGLNNDNYSCWISVNERENGQNAARILCDHFTGQCDVKIGLLIHGTPFFATKQRDFFAEQVFREEGSNVKLVSRRMFYSIDRTYEVCKRMIQDHPEIQGLYITWERPALQAIRALKELGREDIAITTTDLDYEIASYMARGEMVVGLSSQRPYDQGVAVATAMARALIGRCVHRCIGVAPYMVKASNLEKAWREILKTKMPDIR